MTNRRSQSFDVLRDKRSKTRRKQLSEATRRRLQMETLEKRRVMAVGPQLAGIQPDSAALLREGQVLHLAPGELTFRFSDGSEIDPATLDAIRITRSGFDGSFSKSVGTTDFNTNGAVVMDFTAADAGEASNGISLTFIKNDLGANAPPRISVLGDSISVELNTNATGRTRARDTARRDQQQRRRPKVSRRFDPQRYEYQHGHRDSANYLFADHSFGCERCECFERIQYGHSITNQIHRGGIWPGRQRDSD